MKKFILALAMLIASLPGAMALDVLENQYVELYVTPCDGDYTYGWYNDPTGGEDDVDVTISGASTCTASFYAPDLNPGDSCIDITIYVNLYNTLQPGCADTESFSIHVCPTSCDLTPIDECITYFTSYDETYSGTVPAGATVNWYLQDVYDLDDDDDTTEMYIYDTGTTVSYLLADLAQPTGPLDGDNIACTNTEVKVLDDETGAQLNAPCTSYICLTYQPTAAITQMEP